MIVLYDDKKVRRNNFDPDAARYHKAVLASAGGNSTYYVTGTCHFAWKIGIHNSVNSGGF